MTSGLKITINSPKIKLNSAYLFVLIVFFFQNTISFSASMIQQEQKVKSAMDKMYQMHYEAANRLFQQATTEEPFHPLSPLGMVATEWLAAQETLGYKAGNRQLLNHIELALNLYREQMNIHPEETYLSFYYGTTLGLKARVMLSEKDWLGVLTSGYNAVRYIRKAEKTNPELWDIQLPIGVFNYYVGVSAGYMKIASWILNESGAKTDGLKQMAVAAEKANYARYEARTILAFIYLYMEPAGPSPASPPGWSGAGGENFELALKYAKMLSDEYPENPYYHFLCAEALLNLNRLDQANRHIIQIEKLTPSLRGRSRDEYILKLHLLKGFRTFRLNDLSGAEKELQIVVTNYTLEMDIHLGYAYLTLGQINDLNNRRKLAVDFYKKAAHLNNRTTACRYAKVYLKKPFVR